MFIYKVYWYILSMFVPIFTSFGIENSSLHSGRPRKLLPLISLSYFFYFMTPVFQHGASLVIIIKMIIIMMMMIVIMMMMMMMIVIIVITIMIIIMIIIMIMMHDKDDNDNNHNNGDNNNNNNDDNDNDDNFVSFQITSMSIICSGVQVCPSLAFCEGNPLVILADKGLVMLEVFPCYDIIMQDIISKYCVSIPVEESRRSFVGQIRLVETLPESRLSYGILRVVSTYFTPCNVIIASSVRNTLVAVPGLGFFPRILWHPEVQLVFLLRWPS